MVSERYKWEQISLASKTCLRPIVSQRYKRGAKSHDCVCVVCVGGGGRRRTLYRPSSALLPSVYYIKPGSVVRHFIVYLTVGAIAENS